MSKKPKLTPTTNDAISNGGLSGPVALDIGHLHVPMPHIEAAHEPTKADGIAGIPDGIAGIPQFIQPLEQPKAEVPQQVATAPRKVALVGTAPSSRLLAPFSDPSWEIWVCSPGNMGSMPRVTRWFEIHGNMLWPENRQQYGENYLNYLKAQNFPIYTQGRLANQHGDFVPIHEVIPNAVPFPYKLMVQQFGSGFFTSSFAWMMALAIYEGVSEIRLFGIDMASRDEYILQRPGFYYFKGEAEKRGIVVSAPNESDIMMPPALYGFSEVTPFGRKLIARETEIKGRLNAMRAERDKLVNNIVYLEGALEDLDYVKNIWGGVGTDYS